MSGVGDGTAGTVVVGAGAVVVVVGATVVEVVGVPLGAAGVRVGGRYVGAGTVVEGVVGGGTIACCRLLRLRFSSSLSAISQDLSSTGQ